MFIDLHNGNFIQRNSNLLLLSMLQFFFFIKSCSFTIFRIFSKEKGYPEKVVLLKIKTKKIICSRKYGGGGGGIFNRANFFFVNLTGFLK